MTWNIWCVCVCVCVFTFLNITWWMHLQHLHTPAYLDTPIQLPKTQCVELLLQTANNTVMIGLMTEWSWSEFQHEQISQFYRSHGLISSMNRYFTSTSQGLISSMNRHLTATGIMVWFPAWTDISLLQESQFYFQHQQITNFYKLSSTSPGQDHLASYSIKNEGPSSGVKWPGRGTHHSQRSTKVKNVQGWRPTSTTPTHLYVEQRNKFTYDIYIQHCLLGNIMWIPVFWNLTLWCWELCPSMHHQIPADLNLQQRSCENLNPHISYQFFEYNSQNQLEEKCVIQHNFPYHSVIQCIRKVALYL
jgi:hypothetical protein